MPTLTTEQQAILTAASGSDHIIVQARAGSGKTFSLIQLLPRLRGSTCLMAFNKAIAKELGQRTESLPFETKLRLEIGTVHALGLKAYSKNLGRKPQINGGKVSFIAKDHYASNSRDQEYFKKGTYIISKMISAAKNSGFGLASPGFADVEDEGAWMQMLEHFTYDLELEDAGINPERAIRLAQYLLEISNRQDNIIDFDDMVYLPLLRKYTLPKYDNVLIDEAQDISPTRRELAFGMLKEGGRVIAVGDEFQAIYGFTGADAQSLLNIHKAASHLGPVTELPLTTCWRCDGAIITEAQAQVKDIQVKPGAETLGEVKFLSIAVMVPALHKSTTLPPERLAQLEPLLPTESDAILCRLNKPNVSMALELIRAGKRARIEGRDLGKKLASHVKAASPGYQFKSLHELIINTEEHGASQARVLAQKERLAQAELLKDEISCVVLLMERCLEQGKTDYADLEWMISDLFDDDVPSSGFITLSSIHKAKGREWSRVYLLGASDYQPFFLATQPWEKQQEQNLLYVAKTRAEHSLIYITDVKRWLDDRS